MSKNGAFRRLLATWCVLCVIKKSYRHYCATSTCTYVVFVLPRANYDILPRRYRRVWANNANGNNRHVHYPLPTERADCCQLICDIPSPDFRHLGLMERTVRSWLTRLLYVRNGRGAKEIREGVVGGGKKEEKVRVAE